MVSSSSKGSAGPVSQDAVKRYILEQDGKDVFEYSIYGIIQVKKELVISQSEGYPLEHEKV